MIHQLSWYGLPPSLSTIPVLSVSSPPLLPLSACRMTGAGSVCGADATATVETAWYVVMVVAAWTHIRA